MSPEEARFNNCLVLSLRHLGDAVVVSGFINALTKRYPHAAVDVLGREELRGITGELCAFREYISVEIPVFGHHRKNLQSMLAAARTIARLRRRKYDCCINLVGDLRENSIARALGSNVLAPSWPPNHPFRRHIRTVPSKNLKAIPDVPTHSDLSYYAAIESFARNLGLGELCWPAANRPSAAAREGAVIGIHPGASHPSKQWTVAKWKMLIRTLTGKNFGIRLYGSPSERAVLQSSFQKEIEEFAIEVITGGIPGFLQSLMSVDLLVCVDSFSCHAAHAVGTPSIVLFGPFLPGIMTPPSGVALSAGHQCSLFPCYKGRSCKNTEDSYVCVRGIQVDAVMREVEAVTSLSGRSQTTAPAEGIG